MYRTAPALCRSAATPSVRRDEQDPTARFRLHGQQAVGAREGGNRRRHAPESERHHDAPDHADHPSHVIGGNDACVPELRSRRERSAW